MMKYILLFLFFFSLYSCTDSLQPEAPDTPSLVFFSLIKPDSVIVASVSKSIPILEEGTENAYVHDITILLYEDDNLADTLERVDSFSFQSKLVARVGINYRFDVKSKEVQNVYSNNIKVLPSPVINKIRVDSIHKGSGSNQDLVEIEACFDTIRGYKYLGYSTYSFSRGKKGHRWNTNEEYQCSPDEFEKIDGVYLAYIGCLNSINCLKLNTENYHFKKIDSVEFNICVLPDASGDIFNVASISKFTIAASDDNFPSNLSGGYGAVLTMSCTKKIIKLK